MNNLQGGEEEGKIIPSNNECEMKDDKRMEWIIGQPSDCIRRWLSETNLAARHRNEATAEKEGRLMIYSQRHRSSYTNIGSTFANL